MLVRYVRQIVDKILPDGPLKQPRVLQNHAEQLVHILAPDLLRGYAVDPDAAVGDLIEPHEKIDHSGLARAGRADDGDLLAGRDMGGKVLDDDLIR